TLFDSPPPVEATNDSWRFRFELAAKETTRFVVRQRRPLQQSYSLSSLNDGQLRLWLDQRYLDPQTESTLKQVVDLRQQIGRREEHVRRLQEERGKVYQDQQRI